MTALNLLTFFLGFGAAILLVLIWPTGRKKVFGICRFALDQTMRKRRNVQKLLELMQERGEMTNRDAQEALSISHATAARYFDELEAQGIVRQVGEAGRSVFYKLR